MGFYKRCEHSKDQWAGCEHPWWARFQVAGHEIKKSTRTNDRRAAKIEERRLRSYYESKAPRRRVRGRLTLADLGGRDCARAAAEGAIPGHIEALTVQWTKICAHFGANQTAAAITHDSVTDYIIARRKAGAAGQTIVREVQAMKRACAIAHRSGHLPVIPQTWPRVKRTATTKAKGRLHPPQVLRAWLAELPDDARDEALIAALTGLRSAELKRLSATWVEPAPPELRAEGVVTILRVPAKDAKARRERLLPLAPEALEIIRRRVQKLDDRSGPILHQGSHKTARTLARRRIGYQTPISLRDLRHTLGTLANKVKGIDAARDMLGHSNISTTNAYISRDMLRVAEATMAVAELVGTAKPAQGQEGLISKRATRLELATPSLGSQVTTALEHVSTCKRCLERVLACAKLHEIPEDVGTEESAQHRPAPLRSATKKRRGG